MKKEFWIIFLAIALGVSGTFGALKVFATKAELRRLAMESKCADIEYQIDKVLSRIWDIEDRYGGSGNINTMTPQDKRRYQDLLKQLEKWRNWQYGSCGDVG